MPCDIGPEPTECGRRSFPIVRWLLCPPEWSLEVWTHAFDGSEHRSCVKCDGGCDHVRRNFGEKVDCVMIKRETRRNGYFLICRCVKKLFA